MKPILISVFATFLVTVSCTTSVQVGYDLVFLDRSAGEPETTKQLLEEFTKDDGRLSP